MSSLGVPGVPWHTQILADQLNLSQPGGTDYAHHISTGTPWFFRLSDGPEAHPQGLKYMRHNNRPKAQRNIQIQL